MHETIHLSTAKIHADFLALEKYSLRYNISRRIYKAGWDSYDPFASVLEAYADQFGQRHFVRWYCGYGSGVFSALNSTSRSGALPSPRNNNNNSSVSKRSSISPPPPRQALSFSSLVHRSRLYHPSVAQRAHPYHRPIPSAGQHQRNSASYLYSTTEKSSTPSRNLVIYCYTFLQTLHF